MHLTPRQKSFILDILIIGGGIAIMLAFLVILNGCSEPFTAGFGSGAAAMAAMADDAQTKFVEAVNDLNAETELINSSIEGIDGSIFIKPEAVEAINSLKGREKDPVFWIGLASVLANAGLIGNKLSKAKSPE